MNNSGDESLANKLQEAARHRTVMDVGAQRIGKTYADALLNAAEQHHQTEEILHEFDALVNDLFRREPQLESFLASSAIGRERKQHVLQTSFDGRASEIFVNFLLVVNEHERLDMLRAIHAAYRELFDKRAGRIRVFVTSAVPLLDSQAETLRQEIRSKFNMEPVLEAQVDPDLIAGMIVRVGDWRLDSSIKRRLHNIREQLVERSSYEIQSGRDRFSSPEGN